MRGNSDLTAGVGQTRQPTATDVMPEDGRDRRADRSGDTLRQWVVVAAVLDRDRAWLLPAGTVVARDLEMAAEQVCAHLPAPGTVMGEWYLVATPATIELDLPMPTGPVVTDLRCAWVNRVDRDGTEWTRGGWVPAQGRLRPLDPVHSPLPRLPRDDLTGIRRQVDGEASAESAG